MARPVTRVARLVLDELRTAANLEQSAPTLGQFVQRLNVSERMINHSLDVLLERGLIKREFSPGGNRRRFYVVSAQQWTDFSNASLPGDPTAKLRKCITGCGRSFRSEGPHHRMCHVCRKRPEIFGGGSVGRVAPMRRRVMS